VENKILPHLVHTEFVSSTSNDDTATTDLLRRCYRRSTGGDCRTFVTLASLSSSKIATLPPL
jgi:hypothetical protein